MVCKRKGTLLLFNYYYHHLIAYYHFIVVVMRRLEGRSRRRRRRGDVTDISLWAARIRFCVDPVLLETLCIFESFSSFVYDHQARHTVLNEGRQRVVDFRGGSIKTNAKQ